MRILVALLLVVLASPGIAAEYRAYWVETFNTPLGTAAQIGRVVDAAVASNANALFVQVRRRGDSWYLESKEPLTEVAGVGEPDASGRWTLDPLRYLVEQAHARGIEVHAFVIVGSIFNVDPSIKRPADPDHVFNRHFWDASAGALIAPADPRQWSTRALPHNTSGTSWNGQRFGSEWYIDPGHPDGAAYTVDVLTHLVERYDVDGLHLDRIRYPEAPIDRPAGEPPGINVGYNETSVERFRRRFGSSAEYDAQGYPVTNDPLWSQWRRDQVTALVRRIWLSATAVKPAIKVSAALITFWTGPAASGGFEGTEAYYRVFQDWESWAEEGILDLVIPMAYKREHVAGDRAQFDDWMAFTKRLATENDRQAIIGLGAFINGIEGTLRQARRALAREPYAGENESAAGVIFYALGDTTPGSASNGTNAAVSSNPFSWPTPDQSTPKRPSSDFFAALVSGGSATERFEDSSLTPLFFESAAVPPMPWKESPTSGHLMGFARYADGSPADGARVVAENLATGATRSTTAEGGGFYGFVGLSPGEWRVTATLGGAAFAAPDLTIVAGEVASGDLARITPRRHRLARR